MNNYPLVSFLLSAFSILFSQEIINIAEIDSVNNIKKHEEIVIPKDQTSSIFTLTSKEIDILPLRTLNDLVALSPGVVLQDDNLYIRGGRDNEVAYYINGISTTAFHTHKNMIYLSPDATETIQVHVGSFDASMGGANSGIITRRIKQGTNQFRGKIAIQADGPGLGKTYLNTTSSGHSLLTGQISGPIIKDKLHFFTSIEKNYQEDPIRWGGKAFEFLNREDQAYWNTTPLDTIDIIWPGYHKAPDQFTNYTGNISFKLERIKNNLSLISTKYKNYSAGYGGWENSSVDGGLRGILRHEGATIRTSTVYTSNGDTSYTVTIPGRRAYEDRKEFFIADELTFDLSKNMVLKLGVGYLSVKTEDKDDWFGNDWEKWQDGNAVQEYIDIPEAVWTPFRSRYLQKTSYVINGFEFAMPGTAPDRYYFKRQIEQWSYNGSLTTLFNHHSIAVGFNYRKYLQREIGVDPILALYSLPYNEGLQLYGIQTYGSINAIPERIKSIYMDGYGYDYDLKKINKRKTYKYYNNLSDDDEYNKEAFYIDGPKKPYELGLYLQDKMEFDDLVVNAGLRIDILDTDEETLIYSDSIITYEYSEYIRLDQCKKVEPYVIVQPRIGVSLPVSDELKIHSYFGKFAQLPDLNSTWFTARDYRTQIGRSGNYYLNPVGFGIGSTTTTQIEIGLSHNFYTNQTLGLVGFYKIQNDLVTAERIYWGEIEIVDGRVFGGTSAGYNRLVNGDQSIIKGIELIYNLKRYNRLAAQLNYTFSIAEGTGSNATSSLAGVERGYKTNTSYYKMDHNQTHVGTAIIDYRFAKNEGGLIFENSGINLITTFSSGHNYTLQNKPPMRTGANFYYDFGVDYMVDRRSNDPLFPDGDSKTPMITNTDLHLYKKFLFRFGSVNVFIRITNLFDRKNILNVFEYTGRADYDGTLEEFNRLNDYYNTEDMVELYNLINIENGEAYRTQIGKRLYSPPRQIFVGFSIEF